MAAPSSRTAARDPRFRKFRIAAYAVYLLAVGTFSVLIVTSVFRSVLAMSPSPAKNPTSVLSQRECVQGLGRQWRRLEKERQDFSSTKPSEKVDERFTRFREEWIKDLRGLEGRCAIHSRERRELAAAFASLERLMDLYMTHAVQYAGEVGPAVDAFDVRLEAARKAAR